MGVALVLLGQAATAGPRPDRIGAPAMPEPQALLVGYYEAFLKDRDIEGFRLSVAARYTGGTLERVVRSGEIRARRAAVLALGLVGEFDANDAVARALRDPDPTVRSLAANALWSIWFRADSAENNAMLERIRALIERGQLEEARALATRLIGHAPDFAEAYNQRALASFLLGHLEESAADCRRVLDRNPHHFGALSGLGQCYSRLDRRDDALKVYRRALKLQPYSKALRETVAGLEYGGD